MVSLNGNGNAMEMIIIGLSVTQVHHHSTPHHNKNGEGVNIDMTR